MAVIFQDRLERVYRNVMKAGKTIVATFSDAEKAQLVKDALDHAGISATVGDESRLEKFFFLSRPLASQKVYVDQQDAVKARQVLEEVDATDHILHGEICCPQCGSPRVDYPQFTRKFMTTTLVGLFCILRIIEKTFYCKECHHTWPPTVSLRAKTDILNWPRERGGVVRQEKG
jgi:hypothetical protein